MMIMKAVSPVVATVLLIAISVVAVVGIWSWLATFAENPNPDTDNTVFSVEMCNLTHAKIRNTGGVTIKEDADFYNESDIFIGVLNISQITGGMKAGNYTFVEITNTSEMTAGIYTVVDSDYDIMKFTCTA